MLTKQTQYRGTVKSSKTGDHQKNKIIKKTQRGYKNSLT